MKDFFPIIHVIVCTQYINILYDVVCVKQKKCIAVFCIASNRLDDVSLHYFSDNS